MDSRFAAQTGLTELADFRRVLSVILSLIIPTKNRREDLIETVKSVIAQSRLPDELIVVDQSETDENRDTLAALLKDARTVRLVYIWDKGITGLPMARNRGFDSSTGDLICYLDDDTTPAGNYFEEVERGFAQFPEWGGLCGQLTEGDRPSRLRGAAASLFRRGMFRDDRARFSRVAPGVEGSRGVDSPRRVRILTGAACSFRRTVLEQFRFDEALTGYALGEDFEFSLRAGREFEFGLYPAARVLHRRSNTGRPAPEELRRMAAASAHYLWLRHRRHRSDDIAFLWLRFGFLLERFLFRVLRRT